MLSSYCLLYASLCCMKLIDRYIIRQYLSSFLFILGMVLVIVVIVDYVEKLDQFANPEITLPELYFDYYLNFIAFFGNLLSPICIFLGVIFFTSRMAARTEIVTILSSGVQFGRMLRPYVLLGLFPFRLMLVWTSNTNTCVGLRKT